MGRHLSEAQVRAYHDDGFVFPVDIFTQAEAAAYRARLEASEAAHGGVNYTMKPYLAMTLADALAHNEALLDAVEDILGPDLLIWDGAFIIKEPGDGRFVSWHQDLTYWGIGPAEGVVSVWLALSHAWPENGCMRAVPGSHRRGVMAHDDTFGEGNLLSRGQTIAGGLDESAAVDIVLAPGQMSLHHGLVAHGSNPNTANERRIGFNLQFIRPEVRQMHMDDDSAMLARGRDACGNFRPEPRPSTDFAPQSLAFARDIGERRQKMLFRGSGADAAKKDRYRAID